MVDLFLRAESEPALAAALPWARDAGDWRLAGPGWTLDLIGPLVGDAPPAGPVLAEDDPPPAEQPEVDERYHANLRCSEDIAALVPAEVVIPLPARPARIWADGQSALQDTPDEISDRQFAQQAALMGLITEAEAEEWAGPGTIPPGMTALVEGLPESMRFPARMMLRGATTYDRRHPMTVALTAAFGWGDAERDAFWRAAAQL